jgi:hypothetical protein
MDSGSCTVVAVIPTFPPFHYIFPEYFSLWPYSVDTVYVSDMLQDSAAFIAFA